MRKAILIALCAGILSAPAGFADDLASVLKEYGADSVDWRDRSGWTPLHYAANWGDAAAIRALIEAGADADARNNGGQTPLKNSASCLRN